MITSNTHPHIDEFRGPTVLTHRDAEPTGESSPRYACHRCGATSYRALMARGADGAMRASGRHACTGCRLEFLQVSEWTRASSAISID